MLSCTRCGLAAGRSRVVPGRGDLQAAVMFTGEAPGKQEDRTGQGFQGAAGAIFDEMLEYLGLARDRIWLNNAVRCRPSDGGRKNRPPQLMEIDACRHWLFHDVDKVAPRVVVTLGRVPFYAVTGIRDWSGYVGRPVTLGPQRMVFALRHPAYLIYRRSILSEYRDDLRRLAEVLDSVGVTRAPRGGGRFAEALPSTGGL